MTMYSILLVIFCQLFIGFIVYKAVFILKIQLRNDDKADYEFIIATYI